MSIILKLLTFLIVLGFLAAIGFTGYYFYVFQPKKMAFIKEQQDIFNACVTGADAHYEEFWDRECRGLGYQPKCRLAGDVIQRIDGSRSDEKMSCGVKYTEALKTINYVFPWDKKDAPVTIPAHATTPTP